MRRIVVLPVILTTLGAAACTTTRADGSAQIQTTEEAKAENVQGAVSAPLRDLNVLRTKIPPALLEALADPYKRPPWSARTTKAAECAQLAALIRPLDDALGADLDTLSQDEDDLLSRETALGAVASVASGTIPFRGWVRRLTGAERHDRLVQAAITAGGVRRAYLKGLGEARGCAPPATPAHLSAAAAARAAIPAPRDPFKPRYPVR